MDVAVECVGAPIQKPAAPAAIMPWAMMENERSAHGGCASFSGRVFSGKFPVMPDVGVISQIGLILKRTIFVISNFF